MKKCMIMLAMLIIALLLSVVVENKDIKTTENIIASTNAKAEYSALKE